MKGKGNMKKISVMTFMFLLLTCLVFLSPVFSITAYASNYISHSAAKPSIVTGPCTNSAFLEIYSPDNGKTCFANNGYMGFRITNAKYLHAGNNNGWVMCYGGDQTTGDYYCSATGTQFPFQAYHEYNFADHVLITQVAITSQSHG